MMLEGKKIIVTGGGSGIGRATCVLAAREGADVAVADINAETGAETVEMVKAEGRNAILIEMDTSKKADAVRMANEAVDAFGTIDGLVCCAIKLVPGRLEELPEEDWDMVMDIGLKGYFLCAQAAGQTMIKNKSGSIVFISSGGGMQTYPLAGAYSVCKAGAIMLSKLFGVEWASHGIRANTVSPGQVRTPMTEAMFQDCRDPAWLHNCFPSFQNALHPGAIHSDRHRSRSRKKDRLQSGLKGGGRSWAGSMERCASSRAGRAASARKRANSTRSKGAASSSAM